MKHTLYTKTQVDVLGLFRREPMLKETISGVARRLGRTYPRVYDAVTELVEEGILDNEKVGKANVISLRFGRKAVSILSFLEEQEALRQAPPHADRLASMRVLSACLVLVTGSYAKGTAKKSSDVDVVVVVPEGGDVVGMQKTIEHTTIAWHPPVHLYAFTAQDVLAMLLEREENYGKEFVKAHLVIKNPQRYFEILKEAIDHGFRG